MKKYLNKIKNEFPQIKWEKATIKTCGWDFIAIILDNKLVFRFPRPNGEYGPSDLNKEIKFLKFLKTRVPLSIPQYKYIADNTAFVGYDIIPGREFSVYQYRRLNSKQKQKAIHDIADFLSSLHNIPLKKIRRFNIKKINDIKEYNSSKRNLSKYVFPHIKEKEILLIKKYLALWQNTIKEKTAKVLIHADFCTEHIIINNKKISGIIDFTDRTIHDPAWDFTRLWDYGPKFIQTIYNQYRGPKDENFLKRSQNYSIRSYLWLLTDYYQGKHQEWYKRNPQFKKKLEEVLKSLD